jgi:hypothetical protein
MPKGKGQLIPGAKVLATGKPNALQPFGTKDLQFGRPRPYPTISMEDNPAVFGNDGHPFRVQGAQGDPGRCHMPWIKDIVALTGQKFAKPENALIGVPAKSPIPHRSTLVSSDAALRTAHLEANRLKHLTDFQIVERRQFLHALPSPKTLGQYGCWD